MNKPTQNLIDLILVFLFIYFATATVLELSGCSAANKLF